MQHVFISYIRDNVKIVDRLVSELRRIGVIVWLDRDNIKPGEFWKDAINEAISSGAYFIACYSSELNHKNETYMHGELRLAIDRLRMMPRNRAWFIPVFINKAEIPRHYISDRELLSDIQAIPLYDNWSSGMSIILQAIGINSEHAGRLNFLLNLMKSAPEDCSYALSQINNIGELIYTALPSMIDCLFDSNEKVRHSAAKALFSAIKGNTLNLDLVEPQNEREHIFLCVAKYIKKTKRKEHVCFDKKIVHGCLHKLWSICGCDISDNYYKSEWNILWRFIEHNDGNKFESIYIILRTWIYMHADYPDDWVVLLEYVMSSDRRFW